MYNLNNALVLKNHNLICNVTGDNLVILSKDGRRVYSLNKTARFIFENCEGKTIEEIANSLYEICNDKESISLNLIINDCRNVISDFNKNGIVYIKER